MGLVYALHELDPSRAASLTSIWREEGDPEDADRMVELYVEFGITELRDAENGDREEC